MVRPGGRHGLHAALHPRQKGCKLARLARLGKFDAQIEMAIPDVARRKLQLVGKGLVEGVPFLAQDDAETIGRQIGQHALANDVGCVKTDLLRRVEHPPGGFLTHRQPAVQHPVNGGDADACGLRHICDGRTFHAGTP
ncbi:hypothetical protein D3C78_1129320 [compost metagenome]